MQTTWNYATYRATLLTFLMLYFFAMTMAPSAHASTTSGKQAHAAGNAKKKAVKNTAATAGKVSLDAHPHQIRQKNHIVHRQNLRTVAYTDPSAASASLRDSESRNGAAQDDIIVHREHSADVQPLTSQAMLQSEAAFVQDLNSDNIIYDKNSDEIRPIASISKLMTALVVAEAGQSLSQILQISDADVDRMRYSRSRLPVGAELSRADMLHLALMSSENRAAHALGRYYPGGMPAFVRAMNDKARSLGMRHTRFVEPTGLSSDNVSTPRDLVKLLQAVNEHPLIHRYTTDDKYQVNLGRGRQLVYNNTNRLVKNSDWDIKISKTGFINEAGECLVMLTRIDNRDVAIVLLNSTGRYSRIGDAVRVRTLVENSADANVAML
jgi:D-alanyl-D-alanine endopeptidase (penicillin-binding protein 7)